MSANLQAVQVRPAIVGDMSRGLIAAAGTMLLEVALGTCLLALFLVALAWDPIDRKLGARGRRIAERTRKLSHGSAEGAYAILPAD
ncbi:MAG TPA: hypothetical protein VFX49_00690 [Chloroflexota bacterium]|nr:hypothetical protein [Chloroflexota bacterium]